MIPRVNSIVILGIDGAGKTTQATLLTETLTQSGHRAELYTRSAGVRLTDPPLVRTERALAAAAAIRDSMVVVRDDGLWVADRFSLCHYAIDRLCPEQCEPRLRAAFSTLPPPDVVVWLDVPVTEAHRRIVQRGEDEETVEYLSALREAYWALPEASEYVVVDGTASKDDVHKTIKHRIGW